MLVEEHGVPLSLVVTGANRHDVTQLEAVLDALVIERPKVTKKTPQHLGADNAYTGEPARQAMLNRNYTPHVRPRGEEARAQKKTPGFRARRWVVEACHSWFNRFRKLNPSYEKTLANHTALLHLAAAIICWRKIGVIDGQALSILKMGNILPIDFGRLSMKGIGPLWLYPSNRLGW